MTEETARQFVERLMYIEHAHEPIKEADRPRLLSLALRGAETQWRPIEEAVVKKYERHLAMVDGQVRFVSYCKTSHVPIWGWNLVDQGPEDCDLCEPTHWMPLPPPPIAGNSGRRAGAALPQTITEEDIRHERYCGEAERDRRCV